MKDFKGNIIGIGDKIIGIRPGTHQLIEGIVTGNGGFGRVKYKWTNYPSLEYQSSPAAIYKLE